MDSYTEMIIAQAETYNSTPHIMNMANLAFSGSEEYKYILLDVFVTHFLGLSSSKHEYFEFVATISMSDMEKILNETHPILT